MYTYCTLKNEAVVEEERKREREKAVLLLSAGYLA
jgi:hypothetical protein